MLRTLVRGESKAKKDEKDKKAERSDRDAK